MSFDDGTKKADSFAQQAMELMQNHDVPAAPENYTVWYNYVSERYPDLKKELDRMIAEKQGVDGTLNDELYDTFISQAKDSALVQETGAKMQDQAKILLAAIAGASGEIEGVNTSIKSSLSDFSESGSFSGIEVLVQSMIMETKRFQKANDELQKKLEQSAEEIEFLQHNLIQAEKESYTDSLTGIANRKKFDTKLAREIVKANDAGSHLCLAVGDIDFFKQFNDTYGHQVGDQVLKLVARSLHENVKGSDLAARYGGEEFALVLPNTELDDAFRLVETIRTTIASRRVRNKRKDKDFGTVTLSLGVAQFKPGEVATDFLGRADSALYQAKKSGRNQTCKAD